ncbi:patatin-like protein [Roseibium hamelinense]|nr:patatin-like protein [Roseibium hamelinense]
MKQIELRLALVFYGGVSLAIYMHGVSREVLHLIRASADRSSRQRGEIKTGQSLRPLSHVETVYRELLDQLAQTIDIQVVGDAIAGASAGGVNGIMLARAIAHDLPLDDHRDLWLQNADVTRLTKPQNGVTRYLKSGAGPVLNRLVENHLKRQIEDPETREKLRYFMQARWFSPPFSGESYISWMLDACAGMDAHHREGATLIPRGQRLDLFVTLTDFYGRNRLIRIDDPAFIEERDHRKILNFHCQHRVPGVLQSRLGPEFVPDLVFAARATSSFPGAFAPATLDEMEEVLEDRNDLWPHRDAFVHEHLDLRNEDLERHAFVDGSVVMNKPFAPVVEAIKQRPAAREVARRLIYIDPVPSTEKRTEEEAKLPGFFRVILASLAHIPRNEPIGEELKDIERHNRKSRWLAQTIAAADPVVAAAVRKILPRSGRIKPADLTRYRAQANAEAHRQAGFAFLNYQSLKLHAMSERIAGLVCGLGGGRETDLHEDGVLSDISGRLAALAGIENTEAPSPDAELVTIFRSLDVDYRVRRLRFVIRRLNGYYRFEPPDGAKALDSDALDRLKGMLYEQIDHLTWRLDPAFYGPETRDLCAVYGLGVTHRAGKEHSFEKTDYSYSDLVAQLSQMMGLTDLDRLQDDLIATQAAKLLPEDLHADLMRAYVGFAFYDIVTFPLLQTNDFSEINQIRVDRISSHDPGTLSPEGVVLRGKDLNTFGAFFNRRWREHDYLWGRLNAADRLVRIVQSAAGAGALSEMQALHLRKKLLRAILEDERNHLHGSEALIEELLDELDPADTDDSESEANGPGAFQLT